MKYFSKPIYVGLLLVFLLAMHLLKIDDPELRYACFGLVSLITGHGVVTNNPFTRNTPTSGGTSNTFPSAQ